MTTRRRTAAAAAGAIVLMFGLSACSNQVKADAVGEQLTKGLKAQSPNVKLGEPSCADGLKAEVGATTDCEIDVEGKKTKYTAKVTEVDGDKVKFQFEAAK